MDGQRIAVVIEDDQDIRELIKAVLNQSGFEVHTASHGAAGVEAVREHHPSVVTLDLGLPDIDGFEVARRIRLFSDSYIIMLTARADELDTLLGLETGADDYLTKPFRPRELRARIGAMLRRPRMGSSPSGVPSPAAPSTMDVPGTVEGAADPLTGAPLTGSSFAAAVLAGAPLAGEDADLVHGGLAINGGARTVAVDGTSLELTRSEFDLLLAMMESGKTVLSKGDLVRRLRGEEYDVGSYINDSDERTIEVHMANLRRKLGDDPRAPRWIKTVRGVGYRLAV